MENECCREQTIKQYAKRLSDSFVMPREQGNIFLAHQPLYFQAE